MFIANKLVSIESWFHDCPVSLFHVPPGQTHSVVSLRRIARAPVCPSIVWAMGSGCPTTLLLSSMLPREYFAKTWLPAKALHRFAMSISLRAVSHDAFLVVAPHHGPHVRFVAFAACG